MEAAGDWIPSHSCSLDLGLPPQPDRSSVTAQFLLPCDSDFLSSDLRPGQTIRLTPKPCVEIYVRHGCNGMSNMSLTN